MSDRFRESWPNRSSRAGGEDMQPKLVVFAGDHGVTAQGVSAYPRAVTAHMVRNMLAGGAAVSVPARRHGPALTGGQLQAALAHETELVESPAGNALLLGEMGIGNTTAAAALMARITGLPLEDCGGRGQDSSALDRSEGRG